MGEGNDGDNRCRKHEPSRELRRMYQSEDQLANEDTDKSCLEQLNGGERYMSSMASDLARLKRSTPIENGKAAKRSDESDLLHVLVSRPEIATKPRDNIVFEGDMDLRTTFETSYEALAKMRLDYWKKYQEQQCGETTTQDDPNQLRGREKRQQSVSETLNREDNKRQENLDHHPSSVSFVPTTGRQRLTKFENNKIVDSRPPVLADKTAAQLELPIRRKITSPKAVENDEIVAAGRCKRQASESETSGNRIEIDRKLSSYETVVPEQQSKPMKKALPNQEMNKTNTNSTTTTFIDPDLSPIIVYDANMNRLEKVGIRKRSKYRPSTSLRLGARGLFGDQKPEETAVQEARNLEKQHFGSAKASAGLRNVNSTKVDAWSQSPEPNSTAESKTDLSLHARNLNNFKQPNNLTFTDHNLLIDSKRKLKDNINMVDHIREHEIVERSTPVSPILLPSADDEDQSAQMMQEDMEKLNLEAQLEEEAAVEEIQRVASNTNSEQIEQQLQQQQHGRLSATLSQDSRHSKLKRTCQNQNFHLYENEYPEIRDNLDVGTKSRDSGAKYAREGPHAKFYKNLFRESPDFILTTGKFMDEEMKRFVSSPSSNTATNSIPQNDIQSSRRAKENQFQDFVASSNYADDSNDAAHRPKQQQRAPNDDSQMNNDPYNNSDNIVDTDSNFKQLDTSNTDAECRVRKLNEDYQYVGSQSGHKYFVEKRS